jgi:hypothetical protein
MNERIKELVKQATLPGYMLGESYVQSRLDEQKFAELIVKEFETVAKQQPWYYDAPSCGWRAPINHVCDVVKEHFGVEE